MLYFSLPVFMYAFLLLICDYVCVILSVFIYALYKFTCVYIYVILVYLCSCLCLFSLSVFMHFSF